jgi:PhnB protein
MTAKTAKVAPIPRGFRSVTPHITTPNVNAAITLYQESLGATLASVETAPNSDMIIFAQIKIGNSLLTIGQGEAFGPGFISLHHYVTDADAIWAAALNAGFTELRALEETYWGDRMGLLTDPLGVRWSIGQRVMRLTADQRNERAAAAMGYPTPEEAVAN